MNQKQEKKIRRLWKQRIAILLKNFYTVSNQLPLWERIKIGIKVIFKKGNEEKYENRGYYTRRIKEA